MILLRSSGAHLENSLWILHWLTDPSMLDSGRWTDKDGDCIAVMEFKSSFKKCFIRRKPDWRDIPWSISSGWAWLDTSNCNMSCWLSAVSRSSLKLDLEYGMMSCPSLSQEKASPPIGICHHPSNQNQACWSVVFWYHQHWKAHYFLILWRLYLHVYNPNHDHYPKVRLPRKN